MCPGTFPGYNKAKLGEDFKKDSWKAFKTFKL